MSNWEDRGFREVIVEEDEKEEEDSNDETQELSHIKNREQI